MGFVHRYPRPGDREVVGLLAASLAFGRVASVRTSIERVLVALSSLSPSPAEAILTGEAAIAAALGGFVHRVYRGPHVARLLGNAGELRRSHGSLGAFFAGLPGDPRERAAGFADALRGPAAGAERGLRHLVPDPRAGSACKRLNLYLRWMVRPADGVDLGLWPVAPSTLVIPVDTHIHRIARNLKLTSRNDASWKTAEEITAALRQLDPHDPVKYDFALCHLGISRDCPSQRDAEKCGRCVLRDVCTHWRRRPRAGG